MTDAFLITVSFFTSTLTAVVGVGGGMLLISVMPGALPASAIVPVHGVVQLASNATRAGFARRMIVWRIAIPFALGSVVGAALGSPLVDDVPAELLPLALGIFILVLTWLPRPKLPRRFPGTWPILGAVQSFLALFIGVTGPLSVPPLLRENLSRDRLVATDAVLNTALHGLKVLTFAALGFAYAEWLPLMAAMIVAVSLGSWVGTHLRSRVPEEPFRRVLRLLLTVLAVRMLILALV